MSGQTYKLIPCPVCGAESTVQKAKPRANGSGFRRRKCSNLECQVEFSTVESVIGGAENAIPALFLLKVLEEAGIAIDRSELRPQNDYRRFFTGESNP